MAEGGEELQRTDVGPPTIPTHMGILTEDWSLLRWETLLRIVYHTRLVFV